MRRKVIENKMLLWSDGEFDELMVHGSMTGPQFDGEPCFIAATDSMSEEATFVYLPLEDVVADIIDGMDALPADEMADRVRAAVERGIANGLKAREEDGRLG